MVPIPGGYKVWTQAVGPKPNILLLHGGPGFSHDYLQCFADFLPKAGLGFYFYDQPRLRALRSPERRQALDTSALRR